MKWFDVDWQGQRIRVPVMRAQGKLWFHWHGETHVLDLNGEGRKSQGGASKSHPGVIQAPMPGKVTKVFAHKGNQVQAGQPMVVMEAMKMEYTLEADVSGQVQEVNCQPGQQVSLHQVLVKIKASGGQHG